MPFISCPICGKKHSDQFNACPFCKGKKIQNPRIIPILVAVLVIIACTVVYAKYTANKRSSERAEIARIEAEKKQIDTEKKRLREERTAQRKAERIAKRAAMTPEELRKEQIQKGFSHWDGSHVALTRIIKEAMNDPESYDHVQTTYRDMGTYLMVTTKFRGKNKFGAMVLNWVKAKADINGNIITVLSQGS